MIAANHFENKIKDTIGIDSDGPSMSVVIDDDDLEDFEDAKRELGSKINEHSDEASFGYMGFYLTAAWIACFYYLLNTLYTDRKDKSILFWKSLPISEMQNVFTKLLVGCVGFVLVSIVIAWITSILLSIIGLGSGKFLGEAISFSGVRLFIWPLAALILGLLWGAPLFAYTIMVSAIAKRSPFLLLILPPIILPILEWIFFSTGHLSTFFGSHMPFVVLGTMASEGSIAGAFSYYLSHQGGSFVLGLVVAAVFITTAIWYRDNKFEI